MNASHNESRWSLDDTHWVISYSELSAIKTKGDFIFYLMITNRKLVILLIDGLSVHKTSYKKAQQELPKIVLSWYPATCQLYPGQHDENPMTFDFPLSTSLLYLFMTVNTAFQSRGTGETYSIVAVQPLPWFYMINLWDDIFPFKTSSLHLKRYWRCATWDIESYRDDMTLQRSMLNY